MNSLTILQDWYSSQCNSNWEHQYGITIQTLDNPGWHIIIDLNETNLKDLAIKPKLTERSKDNWIFIKTENLKMDASCGPENLTEMLNIVASTITDPLTREKSGFDQLVQEVNTIITTEINKHSINKKGEYNMNILTNCLDEIQKMSDVRDSSKYQPSYPKFILDWPEHSELGEKLLKIVNYYEQLSRNKVKHSY